MSEQTKKPYKDALYDIFRTLSSGITDMQATLGAYGDTKNRGTLALMMDTFRHRLTYHTNVAHRSMYSGLAFLEYFATLHSNAFEALLAQKPFEAKADPEARRELSHEEKTALKARALLSAFHQNYGTECAAERASDTYQQDKELITKTLTELGTAIHGVWSPERVFVFDRDSGASLFLETPSSADLTRLSRAAAKASPTHPIKTTWQRLKLGAQEI